jgi:hypothetical protein
MAFDRAAARIDPRFTDSIYCGPAAGHVNSAKAEKVGMGRAYGYGVSMSAWLTDYVSYWAGNHGGIRTLEDRRTRSRPRRRRDLL